MKPGLLILACLLPGTALAQLDFRYTPAVEISAKRPQTDRTKVAVLNALPQKTYVALGRLEVVKGNASASNEELMAYARSKASEMGADFVVVQAPDAGKKGPAGSIAQNISGRTLTSAPAALTLTVGAYPAAGMGVEYVSPMITGGKRVVGRFLPGSKAAEGGLQSGDEILTVNGVNIEDRNRNAEVLLGFRPGDSAAVTVKRADKVLNLKVPLVANE